MAIMFIKIFWTPIIGEELTCGDVYVSLHDDPTVVGHLLCAL